MPIKFKLPAFLSRIGSTTPSIGPSTGASAVRSLANVRPPLAASMPAVPPRPIASLADLLQRPAAATAPARPATSLADLIPRPAVPPAAPPAAAARPALPATPPDVRTPYTAKPTSALEFGRQLAGLPQRGSTTWDKAKVPWNLATTPYWDPFLRHSRPGLAKALRYGTLGTAAAPLAIGAADAVDTLYHAPEIAANTLRDTAREVGYYPSSNVADPVYQRLADRRWDMIRSIALDNDPVAEAHRRAGVRTQIRALPYGMHQFRQRNPWLMRLADATGLANPIGLARLAASRLLPTDKKPNTDDIALEESQRLLHAAMADPEAARSSPLTQIYSEALNQPGLLNDISALATGAPSEKRWQDSRGIWHYTPFTSTIPPTPLSPYLATAGSYGLSSLPK